MALNKRRFFLAVLLKERKVEKKIDGKSICLLVSMESAGVFHVYLVRVSFNPTFFWPRFCFNASTCKDLPLFYETAA